MSNFKDFDLDFKKVSTTKALRDNLKNASVPTMTLGCCEDSGKVVNKNSGSRCI